MRLIDADVMREDWLENGENEHVYDTNAFLASIDEQPTIEAVPVVHGSWITQNEGLTQFMCSICKGKNYGGHENFCPNCGADMRKKV